MVLKYLFCVEYQDGTIYEQNAADVSITDKKRSCYFDVKQDLVKNFFLVGADRVVALSLEDGHFEVNGVPFFLHDRHEPLKDRRLIYYRDHIHNFSAETKEELSHHISFVVGWQANNAEGKNIQHTIIID